MLHLQHSIISMCISFPKRYTSTLGSHTRIVLGQHYSNPQLSHHLKIEIYPVSFRMNAKASRPGATLGTLRLNFGCVSASQNVTLSKITCVLF